VADVLEFLVPYVAISNDTALIGDEERQIVHLRAFVLVFKCEADTDYHLEVADSGRANARRIILEALATEPAVTRDGHEPRPPAHPEQTILFGSGVWIVRVRVG
jgi:hypothetical protein